MDPECMMPSNPFEFAGETMRYYRCNTATVCQGQNSYFHELYFVV